MDFKILNFNKTERYLVHENIGELLTVSDYWQWYTTGIEDLVKKDDGFIITKRYDNERSEVLAYNFYENESVADVIVLSNNDNFLWDVPGDYDLLFDITEQKLQYFKNQHKVPLTAEQEEYWNQKMKDKVLETHKVQTDIVIPLKKELQRIIRMFNNYLEERIVT